MTFGGGLLALSIVVGAGAFAAFGGAFWRWSRADVIGGVGLALVAFLLATTADGLRAASGVAAAYRVERPTVCGGVIGEDFGRRR